MIPAFGATDQSIEIEKDRKLREVLLFFIDRGGKNLGKTKLMKLLYYADFGYFASHDRSITGARYRKYPRGPVADDALKVLGDLVRTRLVTSVEVPVPPYTQYSYEINGTFTAVALDADELDHLDRVWKKWAHQSTSAIVSASHDEVPWRSVSLYEEIPYHTAYFL